VNSDADGVTRRDGAYGPFTERDYETARTSQPLLFAQVTKGRVSLEHIALAWRIRHDPSEPVDQDEWRTSEVLEYLARKRFAASHRQIEKDYWTKSPFAGCALTGDGWVHSVMNTDDAELVLYENAIHQLCRDAHRTFEKSAPSRGADGGRWHQRESRSTKAAKDLEEIGQMLYGVLARVLSTAVVLEARDATPRRKDEALAAVRVEWQAVQRVVEDLIQRQARFEYFQGMGIGALLVIPSLLVLGLRLPNISEDPFGQRASITAALIGGATGAIISVTQRTNAKTLVIDFTAPKYQKIILGALRPLVGAVFAGVVYFVFVSGLLAVEARPDELSKALAFFAVVGFASGFSERFATDVIDRATTSALPSATSPPVQPQDPAILLSNIPRRVEDTGSSAE
jgi:hypothetical protein